MAADLDFIKVVGRFGLTVGDGGDADEDPDITWCDSGSITFEPVNTYTKVAGASPIGWTGGQATIDAPLDASGYLTRSGMRRVSVVDLTSAKVNPQVPAGKATHVVRFVNVKAGATTVGFPQVSIRIAPDDPGYGVVATAAEATELGLPIGTPIYDLVKGMPVPTAGGTPIVVGPQGASIASLSVVGNSLVATLNDPASTQVSAALPSALTDSDAATANRISTNGSATATALDARYASVITPQGHGAFGDGTHDDTAAMQAAIDDAAAAGKRLFIPSGTYIVTGLTLRAYTVMEGAGIEKVTFKLKAGTTADVFISENFASLTGGNTNGGCAGVRLSGFTVDGNKANANPGWGIKKYGYRWRMRDLDVKNCKSGGIYSEWCRNPLDGADGGTMEDRVENVNVHDGTGFGVQWRGPHDSMMNKMLVFRIGSGGHGISLEGSDTYHSGGILMSDVHVYGCGGNGIQTLPDSTGESATIRGINIESESNGGDGLYLASNSNYIAAGNFYNNTGAGIEIANGARAYQIDGTVNNNTAAQLKYTNDGGYGFLKLTAWANSKPTVVGTKGPKTVQHLSATGEAAGTVTELGLGTVAPRDITDLFSDDNATLIDSISRYSAQGELLLSSGRLDLCYFTARRTLTLPNTITATTTQAAAGLTLARIGLYSVATNGDLTLIASTPSDTTLWGTTGATVVKAFSAPASLVAGQRYAIGVLASGTTMPKLAGMVVVSTVVTSLAPKMKASLTTADLPSTITNGSLSSFGSSGMPFVRIAP